MENQAQNFTSGTSMAGINVDFNKILSRVKSILFDPANTWTEIKSEQLSIADLYKNYFLVLAALPPIARFLGGQIFGISIPFLGTIKPDLFPSLFSNIIQYGLSLGALYVLALVLQFVAKNFSGNPELPSTFKLAAFASVPTYVFGVLGIMPGFVAVIGGLLSLYSIYVFWTGITPMTGVPEAKRIPFVIVSAILGIIIFFVVGVISATVMPRPAMPSFNHTMGDSGFDPQKFEQGINELQKIIPNAGK